MPFDIEKPVYCSMCDPTPDGLNICSPLDRLSWAIWHFNYCPCCGRQLPKRKQDTDKE